MSRFNPSGNKELNDKIKFLSDSIGIGVNKFANGNGVDETANVQNALNEGAGKIVIFPYGKSYKVNKLSIPSNTIIFGYGSKIYNTDTHQTLLSIDSSVKVYGLEVQGAGNSSVNYNGKAVEIKGSYNETLATISYVVDVLLEDCYFHNMGGYGVYGEYAKFVKIVNCKIEHVGYAGVQGLSVENFHVIQRTHIKDVSPGGTNYGGASIAYGVIYTRLATQQWSTGVVVAVGKYMKTSTGKVYKSTTAGTTGTVEPSHTSGTAIDGTVTWQYLNSSDLNIQPRSKDCTVTECTIEDIPVWEALDTHGGENIVFDKNTIRNCKIGVALVPTQYNGLDDYAPQYCKATHNTIYGNGDKWGISCTGASSTASTVFEHAVGCEVSGNTLIKCGENGNGIAGAMYLHSTRGLIVNANNFKDCYALAINIYHNNKAFSVTSNTIIDVQDGTYTVATGIGVRSDFNDGLIDGNTLLKVNATLNTYVSIRGIYMNTPANNNIVMGVNYNTFDTPLFNMNGQTVVQGFLGRKESAIYAGTAATPEGTISAGVGSIYIKTNGGAGTTFFVKESGTGNTGWVGK